MKVTLMKLLACLLISFATCFPGGPATAQTTSRPDQKDARTPLVEALEKITQVFGTQFVYDPKPMEGKYTTVKMDGIKGKTVEDVLKSILYPNNFVFLYIKSNYYTIVTKDKVGESLRQQPASNPPVSTVAAPETKPNIISGTVIDARNGQPLSGASVLVNGTQSGGVTDQNGRFSITAHNVAIPVLHVSIVGYENMDVKTDGLTEMAIKLNASTAALGEVVVVGYGTQKKKNLTGAVSVVSMDDVLGSRPIIRADEALEGVIPGLNISSNSGQPGHPGTTLNIRGYTSINGGSPLVLVDNVPMPIGDVNPADIETVTVLKDAAAASIYGARAAFGVILISTKKGKKNRPLTFNYSANLTSTIASGLPEKATPLEFVSALNDFGTKTAWVGQDVATWLTLLKEYESNPAAYTDGKKVINGVTYPLANSDVYGSFFRKGFEHLHNLSFGGGSEKSIYRISLGYTDQNGIMVTNKDRYRKYNLNTFLSTDLAKNLVASLNVFYKNDFLTTPGNFATVIGYAVDQSSYSPTGIGTTPTGEKYPFLMPNNILKYETPQEQFGDDIRLFGKLEYAPVSGLKVTAEYTFNRTVDNDRQTTLKNQYISPDTYVLTFLNNETSYKRSTASTNYRALNVYGNYTRNFGNHNIGLLAGTNRETSKYEGFNVSRLGLISSQVPSVSTSSGTIGGDDEFAEYAIVGYFSRINYNYKEKYLLEANGRYDGSSRFAPGHQFGFFPSVSAGWQVSNENFMAPLKRIVSSLKFRGSYGEIGNQVIVTNGSQNYYPYIPGMNPFNVSWINGSTNVRYLSLSAPALVSAGFSWETVQTANVGIDLGLVKNKLIATFELYNRKTLNMLAPGLELPAVLGTSAPLQNVADLKSKGWELSVAWRDAIKKFHYSFGFNVSDNRAYITRFKNEAGLISNYYKGQQLGELWGYVTQGYFTVDDFEAGTLKADLTGGVLKKGIAALEGMATKQNPGDIRYVDLNGDGIVNNGNGTLANPGDKKIIGNTNSRYLFGITGNAEYKNFDFSFFVQGVGKRDIWINTDVYWPYRGQYGEVFKHQLDYWTAANTDGFYPRMYPQGGGNTGNSELLQTKYLSNGAYLRIKNITLGYSIPKNLSRRILLTNARLFFSGENLFTKDDLATGLNADNANISSGGYYPFLKKYSFGLNVSF